MVYDARCFGHSLVRFSALSPVYARKPILLCHPGKRMAGIILPISARLVGRQGFESGKVFLRGIAFRGGSSMGHVTQTCYCLVIVCFGNIFRHGLSKRDFTKAVGGK